MPEKSVSMTDFETFQEGPYLYLQEGNQNQQEPLLLLHGLFGTASNFDAVIRHFSKERTVVLPVLPIFEMPFKELSVAGLLEHVLGFVKARGYERVHLLGNSLGGHVALLYALEQSGKVKTMTLTGSSGLFENAFGSGFPRREDYDFIRNKVGETFYDPAVATKAMVDEVFEIVNDRGKALRIVKTAKSAIRHNVGDRLGELQMPTLLVWGKQDTITPLFVAEKFHELLPNSQLVLVDQCGHAPMLERPDEFNSALADFLKRN